MVGLEPRPQSIQHQVGVFTAGFFDFDERETPRERRVGAQRPLVLIEGGRSDARELATCQRELQLGADFVRSVAAEKLMDLVEEDHDFSTRGHHLTSNCADAGGQRATDAGSSQELANRDFDHELVVQRLHVLAQSNALGESAHDARLADACDADQTRIVPFPLGEHVQRLFHGSVPTDDRIQFAAQRRQREIFSERRERGKFLSIELETVRRRYGRRRDGARDRASLGRP
jgi:hypothetical protein